MLAVPVVHYRPRHLALSTEHPMHCGWDPQPLLKEADVVLVVDCDVPWIPKEGKPKAEAKVIHARPRSALRFVSAARLRADIALTGAVAPTLQALWRAAQKQAVSPKRIEERRKAVSLVSDEHPSERESGRRSDAGEHHRKGSPRASTRCSTTTRSSSTSTRPCSRKW